MFHHLLSVGPKQLCASVHLRCTRKVGIYFLIFSILLTLESNDCNVASNFLDFDLSYLQDMYQGILWRGLKYQLNIPTPPWNTTTVFTLLCRVLKVSNIIFQSFHYANVYIVSMYQHSFFKEIEKSPTYYITSLLMLYLTYKLGLLDFYFITSSGSEATTLSQSFEENPSNICPLRVPASRIHPWCAAAHNFLGLTLRRWWNTKIWFC